MLLNNISEEIVVASVASTPDETAWRADYAPDNVLVDTLVEQKGTFWIGPDDDMPQGFIMDFAKLIYVDIVKLRNGFTKGWASGTQDFEILLGNLAGGPWKSILNETLAKATQPANPPEKITFRSEENFCTLN